MVFDSEKPIRSTGDVRPWYTGKPCAIARRSHIGHCVFDSAWEASEAFELERNKHVAAWVKNDPLGYEMLYVHKGVVRNYRRTLCVAYVGVTGHLVQAGTLRMLTLTVRYTARVTRSVGRYPGRSSAPRLWGSPRRLSGWFRC